MKKISLDDNDDKINSEIKELRYRMDTIIAIEEKNLEIVEGVESTWYYHLSKKDNFTRSLCGARTMITSILPNSWGFRSPHIRQRYCKKCEELARFHI